MTRAFVFSIFLILCLPIHGRPHSFAERTGIDGNWWGTCLTPTASSATCAIYYWSTCDASEIDAENIAYTYTSKLPLPSTHDGVICGGGISGDRVWKKKAIKAQAAPPDTVPYCQNLLGLGQNYNTYNQSQMCYDTLKKFIETCPLWQESWRAFGYMSFSVQPLSRNDTELWTSYRNWLESVLYLNTVDPEYFCACVEAIATSFYSAADTTPAQASKGLNTRLAVYQWLIENTACDTPSLGQTYHGDRVAQYNSWLADSNAYQLDTTLPTMKQLGLDSILKLHNQQGVVQPAIYASDLQSFSLSENPFVATTMLRYNLSKTAYIRTEVYDELGRTIIGDGTGRVYDPGLHQQQLDLSKFSSGVYYLRISAGDGETRTIKMVRRE